MAHTVLRKIVANASQSKFFGLIADEATDSAGKQQLSVFGGWAWITLYTKTS
jgi:hypothetical protein